MQHHCSEYDFVTAPGSLLLAALLVGGTATAAVADERRTCPPDRIAQGEQPPAGREWKCTTRDGVVDGPWLTWYDDQQLLSERNMKLGKEHGRQRMWWPNGQLMMEGVSVDGHRYQGFKYWSVDGTPTELEIQTETVTQPYQPPPTKPAP
jgi:hypothetical protein